MFELINLWGQESHRAMNNKHPEVPQRATEELR